MTPISFEQAAAAYESGNLRQAWETCEALFDKGSPDHRILHLMGLIAHQRRQHSLAQSLLEQSVRLAPDNPLYLCNLSLAMFAQGGLEAGIEGLDKALALRPGFPLALDLKSSALMQLDRAEQARPLLDELARKNPAPRRIMSLALCLQSLGRLEEACENLQGLLGRDPTVGQAWWLLASMRRATPEVNQLAAMSSVLAGDLRAEDRIPLLFAIAREHENLGNFDQAFAHYEQANALRRTGLEYSIESDEALIAGIIRHDSGPFSKRRETTSGQTPIFVVSMPRTGSTLVERILGAHSQVRAAGELQLIPRLVHARSVAAGRSYPESIAALGERDYREMRSAYLEQSQQWRDASPLFVDKMPINFLYLGVIARMFPEAPLIHVHRNAVDTCLSCYRHLFGDYYQFAYDQQELGRYYVLYRKLMAHWSQALPGRILNLAYERLVQDAQGQAQRLLAHCGLEWEPACLDFTAGGAVRTPSAAQVRREIYQDSVGRWRRYEPRLEPLLSALGPYADA